ncbi:hypothetical protein K239x_06410 [Planctomycetes bacterium K23_9]|uniref:PDZ domain-containing protein n=1 Tax=Stieleria marina TaxID=1930275 RepID=A0A517NNK8_9BACT|nr:hypothetical protein K239x_06410 [Planctomycetes bacterium K23_9]
MQEGTENRGVSSALVKTKDFIVAVDNRNVGDLSSDSNDLFLPRADRPFYIVRVDRSFKHRNDHRACVT